jgi:hypothetical protein
MKQAIWLYLYLLLIANPVTGKGIIAPARAAQDMGLKETTVRSWLGHLRKAGYIHLRRAGDLFIVTISKWRPVPSPHEVELPHRRKRTRRVEKPVVPEELAQVLGGSPEDSIWKELIAAHSQGMLRRALTEVSEVPANRIRKSRLALFRYLLKKHSSE